MGGGGYDHWDVETERENERRNHRCLSIEDLIQASDAKRLARIVKLALKRTKAIAQEKKRAKDRAKREAAYKAELDVVAAGLRKKHGL